jgi:branched-chain amino acid transport system ATP-binding protein
MNNRSSDAALAPPAEPAAAAEGVLEVRDVSVRFGGLAALDSVSLSAPPGKVTGIIGPNGAGKTTLLNAVCGFVAPVSGAIFFGRSELTRIRPHRLAGLGISRTLQGVGLFSGLSVAENVMVGATHLARGGFWSGLLGLSDSGDRRLRHQALEALERLGVADLADRMPGTLAYGLRKRVALARALVGHPQLLLLDEPASGLPERELAELGELIRQSAAQAGVVVIEHRMDLVMSVCDTIFVLDFGKLIAAGPPEQVQADPAVTAAYLGAERDGASEAGQARDEAAEAGQARDEAAETGQARDQAAEAGRPRDEAAQAEAAADPARASRSPEADHG